MSDILEATADHLQHVVDGTEYRFDFLNVYDRAELLRVDLKRRQDAHVERKAKLIENLKLAGIEKAEMFNELEHFDDQYPTEATEDDWVRFCQSPSNAILIHETSLRSVPKDQRRSVAEKTFMPLAKFVRIVGLTISEKRDEADPKPAALMPYGVPAPTPTGDSVKQGYGTGSA